MVFSYITSSWNSLTSAKKPTSEQSQTSRDNEAIQSDPISHSETHPLISSQQLPSQSNLYPEIRTVETRAVVNEPIDMARKELMLNDGPMTSPGSRVGTRVSRRERQKKRKRRPSLDTSILSLASEGDIASIPYRADEQSERDAFLQEDERASAHVEDRPDVGGDMDMDESTSAAALRQATGEDTSNTNKALGSKDNAQRVSPVLKLSENGAQNRYPCPGAADYGCDQSFTMLSAARRHMRSKHETGQFPCQTCGKTYNRPGTLRTHQLTHEHQSLPNGEQASHHQDHQPARESRDPSASVDIARQTQEPSPETHNEINAGPINGDVNSEDHLEKQARTNGRASPVSVSEDHSAPVAPKQSQSQSSLGQKRKRKSGDVVVPETDRPVSKKQKSRLQSSSGSDTSSHMLPISTPVTLPSSKAGPSQLKTMSSKSGNLNSFVKPWVPGSGLRHPAFNPRSPRKASSHSDVEIPESSHATSVPKHILETPTDSLHVTPLAGRDKRSAFYSSAKGKQRADPDVEYSSPSHVSQLQGADNDLDHGLSANEENRRGMATTVARKSSRAKKARSQPESDNEEDEAMDESESEYSSSVGPNEPASPSGDVYLCQECHRKFPSRVQLRKHENRPNAHKLVAQCEDCRKSFGSREMLKRHQQEAGHGDGTGYSGRKGAFSASEINKLCRWRDNFCAEHELNHVDFNNMMTDSLRRNKGFVWPYRFITKVDFLQGYYDVLPNRNRRSMHRYRERAFQNVTTSHEWTRDDDRELIELIKEIGPKWVDIGQRLSRTSDSVYQRWRNKLRYRGKQHDGEWLKPETNELIKAVREVKRESGIPLDSNAGFKLSWDSVSKKMKGKRTAQQCSNKWRLMYSIRRNGVFIKVDDHVASRSNSGTPLSSTTPSKMSRRLEGVTPSKRSPHVRSRVPPVSDKYVHNSDDEEMQRDRPSANTDSEQEAESDVEEASDEELEAADEDMAEDVDVAASDTAQSRQDLPLEKEDRASHVDEQSTDDKDEAVAATSDSGLGDNIAELDAHEDPTEDAEARANGNSTEANEHLEPASDDDSESTTSASDNEETTRQDDDEGSSLQLPPNPFSARTPRNTSSLTQAFNQTQANTSAVRAPRGERQTQSQPTQPSPEIAIRARPESTISEQPLFQSSQLFDHAGSSDESSSESDTSSDNDDDDSNDDEMVSDTRKESFIQTLRSSAPLNNNQAASRSVQTPKRVDWARTLSGQARANDESSSSDESR